MAAVEGNVSVSQANPVSTTQTVSHQLGFCSTSSEDMAVSQIERFPGDRTRAKLMHTYY